MLTSIPSRLCYSTFYKLNYHVLSAAAITQTLIILLPMLVYGIVHAHGERVQIDAPLVQELVRLRDNVHPQEILLVADAALGQEAVSVARHFDEALSLSGIILTKLDGDARGGAALSMRQTTGKPIKFITTGEQPMDLESFHPDRMASRILGMGDILTLVERAESEFKEEEARQLEEKVRNATFDFDDFLQQLSRINKMGGIMSLLKFLPGMNSLPKDMLDEKTFIRRQVRSPLRRAGARRAGAGSPPRIAYDSRGQPLQRAGRAGGHPGLRRRQHPQAQGRDDLAPFGDRDSSKQA